MSETILHQILKRAGFSPITKNRYQLVIDRWIEFAGSDPNGWTRNRAQDFYDQLLETVSIQSANTYLGSLRYVSRWYATKTGGLDFAIVQRQRGKKGQGRKRDGGPILTQEEARALLESCVDGDFTDRRDLALLTLGLETGMRRMSFIGLNIEAVSHARGFPSVVVPIKGPGGEETFDVPLSDTAFLALSSWIAWLKAKRITTGPVFRRISYGRLEGPFSSSGINDLVEARANDAGIRHVNPHMLRHTFISWRNQAGYSPLDIAEITGHKVKSMIVDGVRMDVNAMSAYLHREIAPIRNATPVWLVKLVGAIVKGFR